MPVVEVTLMVTTLRKFQLILVSKREKKDCKSECVDALYKITYSYNHENYPKLLMNNLEDYKFLERMWSTDVS